MPICKKFITFEKSGAQKNIVNVSKNLVGFGVVFDIAPSVIFIQEENIVLGIKARVLHKICGVLVCQELFALCVELIISKPQEQQPEYHIHIIGCRYTAPQFITCVPQASFQRNLIFRLCHRHNTS